MIIDFKFISKSFFLPEYSIKMFQTNLGERLSKRLAEIVLLEKNNILKNTKKHQDERDDDWLTARLWDYNFLDFDYPEVKELKQYIKTQFLDFSKQLGHTPGKVYIQCWANIIKNDGRIITPHEHANAHAQAPGEYAYLSGNICLQAENTQTYYRNPFLCDMYGGITNVPGDMILFPSYVIHWTDPNHSPNPRISIAFDLITEEVYNMLNNTNYREL